MTVAALAADLIRATVKHGYPAHGTPVEFHASDVVRARDLHVASEVSLDESDDWRGASVTTEAYIQVTAENADGLTARLVWPVSLADAVSLLSVDVTVEL